VSELGDRYKQATEEVLKRYETELDTKGRSQRWKLAAIEEDRKNGRDSGLMKDFAEQVEATVNRLNQVKIVVAALCKQACVPPTHNEPAPTDTSVHGIDLGWD
jgi:hypothetical protein